MTQIDWRSGRLAFHLTHGNTAVLLETLAIDEGPSAVRPHPLTDLFTDGNRRSRVSAALVGSVVGERLRYVTHRATADTLEVDQRDPVDGLLVTTRIRVTGTAFQQVTTVHNGGPRTVTLLALASTALRTAHPAASGRYTLVSGRNEWLGEGRYRETPLGDLLPDIDLPFYNQDTRGRVVATGTGSWSTAGDLPTAVLVDIDGPSLAWQVESSAAWTWELSQAADGVVLVGTGPTEADHGFVTRLAPGETFTGVPVGVALSEGGRDGAIAALTAYRRSLRVVREDDLRLPVIYTDYLNTLMGQPSTEALLPLIAGAADAGAEYFCIDAGWFTDDRDHWDGIGMWEEAPTRFTGGLRSVIDAITAAGMLPGLWLEPEAVGVRSPLVDLLPAEAFFHRHGSLLVEQSRRMLDLRHPAARAHLDAVVDRLVADFGVRYLKLDYNVDAGTGTDVNADSAAAGLLGHAAALHDWVRGLAERHPRVLIENCASGAMRMDHGLLPLTHVQSTSDQQDAVRYATIAAAAPLSILPEQAGNWAYPAAAMSDGELATTLVSGVMGRMILSGFLPTLSPTQLAHTHAAVALHKRWREHIAASTPRWPLGLPDWDAPVRALALDTTDGTLLAIWSRDTETITLPGVSGMSVLFDPAGFSVSHVDDVLTISTPSAPAACIIHLEESS